MSVYVNIDNPESRQGLCIYKATKKTEIWVRVVAGSQKIEGLKVRFKVRCPPTMSNILLARVSVSRKVLLCNNFYSLPTTVTCVGEIKILYSTIQPKLNNLIVRNPKWHRDEIILALDLYFDVNRGSIDARNPKVIELSETLNKLPLFSIRPDEKRFRNPNGVSLKLSNFSAIDPDYMGKGMEAYSKLDKELFDEFYKDRQRLKQIAHQIKQGITDESL